MKEIILLFIISFFIVSGIFIYIKQKRSLPQNNCFIIIFCTSKTKNLENIVKSTYWEELFEDISFRRDIIIVLNNAEQNEYTAKRLAHEIESVTAIDISALPDYLKQKQL